MLVSAGKTPGLGARAQGLRSFSASAHRGLPWKGLQVPAPHTIPRQSAGPRSASVLGPRAPKLCPPPTAHQAHPPVTAPARVRDQPKRTCGTRTLSPRAVGWARRPAPDPYTATRHGDPGSEVGNPRGPESPHPGKPAMTVSGVRADARTPAAAHSAAQHCKR